MFQHNERLVEEVCQEDEGEYVVHLSDLWVDHIPVIDTDVISAKLTIKIRNGSWQTSINYDDASGRYSNWDKIVADDLKVGVTQRRLLLAGFDHMLQK